MEVWRQEQAEITSDGRVCSIDDKLALLPLFVCLSSIESPEEDKEQLFGPQGKNLQLSYSPLSVALKKWIALSSG